MVPIYKEAGFPAHYRQTEMRQVMEALYRLRSIAITGLAGMGKSNVVRFIVSHPRVRARYLGERATGYAFVHVDCTGLAESSAVEILSEIATQLPCKEATPVVPPPILEYHTLRRFLKAKLLDVQADLSLVVILDDFDEAAQMLDKGFFNYLCHLRNIRPRGNLSYIFATRRPMGQLYELQELLDDGCVVGPLSYRDASDSLRRDEVRLGTTFDRSQSDKLITCAGGHPGFLKNAAELVADGHADAALPEDEFSRQLLRSTKVVKLCEELWNDLTPAEQDVLLCLVRGVPLSQPDSAVHITHLKRFGLVVDETRVQGTLISIFCPLFKAFVGAKVTSCSTVCITAVFPNLARIETPAGVEQVTLSPKLFALLQALAGTRDQILSTDEIIHRVYGDEANGVTNAALSQLVKRLRAILDPSIQRMTDDRTYTCVETVRSVGYRFAG